LQIVTDVMSRGHMAGDFRGLLRAFSCAFLTMSAACAPISSPPSMSDPGGVPVPEVIQQIKCGLMQAIAAPMKRRDIARFRNFAAKIDLTLKVRTVNQLNPTVVFNNPLHNAYPQLSRPVIPFAVLKQNWAAGKRQDDMRFLVLAQRFSPQHDCRVIILK
jgi:hypothetical protein